MTLSWTHNSPWETPVNPVQLIAVGVILGMLVGRGVRDGVKVNVGGMGLAPAALVRASWVLVAKIDPGVPAPPPPDDGMLVVGMTAVAVGVLNPRAVEVGTRDGVGDSAANSSGIEDPTIGIAIKNVRALAETTVNGSSGRIGMIGS